MAAQRLSVRFPPLARGSVARTFSVATGFAAPPRPLVVLFPPQPALGGDGENNVVLGVERALLAAGFAALRFDYRHSGPPSDGEEAGRRFEFWRRVEEEGVTEPAEEDGVAAVRFAQGLGDLAGFAGYSFGAIVAALVRRRLGLSIPLAALAPPVARYDVGPALDREDTLLVFGERDVLEPPPSADEIRRRFGSAAVRRRPRSDHFFRGEEAEIGELVTAWLRGGGR